MANLQKFGKDPINVRDLYFLSVKDLNEIPSDITLSSPNFACLIVWDSRNATVDEISSIAEPLLEYGCSYFCSWGPGCERVHDIIDEIDSKKFIDLGSSEESIIMTTWRNDEILQEALYFFLNETWPDEYYEGTTLSSLAIVIGNQEWSEIVKKALMEPGKFNDNYINNEC